MAPTYDFTLVRFQIIRRALRLAGALKADQEPKGDDMQVGAVALEGLIKWLQSEDLKIWTKEHRTQAVTANTASYQIGLDVLDVLGARIVCSDGSVYGLNMVSEDVFKDQTNNTDTGRPELIKFDLRSTAALNVMRLWPIPDLTYTIEYEVVRKMADFDTAVGTLEMPQRWLDPICYTLADNIADELHTLPLDAHQRLSNKARALREIASRGDTDPEDTTYLDPI